VTGRPDPGVPSVGPPCTIVPRRPRPSTQTSPAPHTARRAGRLPVRTAVQWPRAAGPAGGPACRPDAGWAAGTGAGPAWRRWRGHATGEPPQHPQPSRLPLPGRQPCSGHWLHERGQQPDPPDQAAACGAPAANGAVSHTPPPPPHTHTALQTPAACSAAFDSCQVSLRDAECGFDASLSGASALCVSASAGGHILVAHAGACGAVLARRGSSGALSAVQLEADARLGAPSERCRLESSTEGVRVEASGGSGSAAAAAGAWHLVVEGQAPLEGEQGEARLPGLPCRLAGAWAARLWRWRWCGGGSRSSRAGSTRAS
jgi:hypothetical protein